MLMLLRVGPVGRKLDALLAFTFVVGVGCVSSPYTTLARTKGALSEIATIHSGRVPRYGVHARWPPACRSLGAWAGGGPGRSRSPACGGRTRSSAVIRFTGYDSTAVIYNSLSWRNNHRTLRDRARDRFENARHAARTHHGTHPTVHAAY